MFFSTRNSSLRVSASQAIIQGLAPDGGLFFPVQIGKVEMKEDLLNKSYQELAFLILRLYLDDFSDENLVQELLLEKIIEWEGERYYIIGEYKCLENKNISNIDIY